MNRTRDGQHEIGQAVDPIPSTRTRPRLVTDAKNNADDDGEDDHEKHSQQSKRLKVQTKSQEPRRPAFKKILLSSLRRSPRLRNLRESRDQLSAREEKLTERSSAAARHRGWKGTQPQKNASAHPQKVKRQDSSKQGIPQGSPLKSLPARRGKRQRNTVSGDESTQATKRQRRQSICGVSIEQADSIERWLDESCPDQEPSTADKVRLLEVTDTMPRKSGAVLPSPEDSFDRNTTSSRKSERTTASVHDTDYHQSLSYRNIYIDREDPPTELMQRANRIITRPRASPEMDDALVQKLKERSRRIRNEPEDVIVKQLAHPLIPAMDEVPDRRLEMNADQPWANSVPIPLDPSILTNPLPLPKPKPDLAFGYSQAAFTRNQLGTIELLVDDQFGRSYAAPDQKLRFPFLGIEFKAQAKNGTHYIATNQAAGAGAIALRGTMDLAERSFGIEKFDYEEPQFFSVTMDHQLACVNVHWLKAPVDGGMHSFHVEGLSQHLLKDADGIRAVTRAIKNILDYGTDQRLRTLCEALDAYRTIVVRNREAANPQKLRHEANPGVRSGQRRRGSELVLPETITKNMRHISIPEDNSADEMAIDQRKTKQGRHGSGDAQNVVWSKSSAASTPISRHFARSARKSAYHVASKLNAPSRHRIAGGAEEPKRQIKPSQKLLESRQYMIDSQGVKPRSRYDP